MTPTERFREEIARIGYSVIFSDYVFSDVFASPPRDRTTPLAAFTHTPPSYRNAALAILENHHEEAAEVVSNYRALGAPLLFVIEGEEVSIWQAHAHSQPTVYRPRIALDQLRGLFSENKSLWSPRRIHQAKSFGGFDRSYQLDFVDVGLLPAIEGEVHEKLDRLLTETLSEVVRLRIARAAEPSDERLLFRTVFRLLAAKVLNDRRHALAQLWDPNDIDAVLKGISECYQLDPLPGETISFKGTSFESAWHRLRTGINFQNISSDNLAFVYENTLVTPTTRKHFGTHSTPRPVAEYISNRLDLWRFDPDELLKVYEPFAGAGAFMVAALRVLRDLLPVEMTAKERHQYLVGRIYGDEIEPFAAEVAMLSLILADYPNENGWGVSTIDLFQGNALQERSRDAQIVMCNPPFEKFSQREREAYPEAASRSKQKAIAALEAILDNRPAALGFVLPEPFIHGRNYEPQRRRVEKLYKDIELVSLPDRVFKASVIRSSLLIARQPRMPSDTFTNLRSTVVNVNDRERFLSTGEVGKARTSTRPQREAPGHLWIEELGEVWEYLSNLPRLQSIASAHRGIEWEGEQAAAISPEPREGFSPGIHAANAVHAYFLDEPVYLSSRPEAFRKRTAAYRLPWHEKKILANAARLSRGPWCFAASIDDGGLLASQQLFGIWPHDAEFSLNALCALLNSPVAAAYIATHSPADRIRVGAVEAIPIPPRLPSILNELVEQYLSLLRPHVFLFGKTENDTANAMLAKIDAAILSAYDLSPRLERNLLEYFRSSERPTLHSWTHWFPEGFRPFIPLHEYVSGQYKQAAGNWLSNIEPLPEKEASALREILG